MRSCVVVKYLNGDFVNNLDKNLFTSYHYPNNSDYVYLYFNTNNKEKVLSILNNIDSVLEIEDSLFDVESIVIKKD